MTEVTPAEVQERNKRNIQTAILVCITAFAAILAWTFGLGNVAVRLLPSNMTGASATQNDADKSEAEKQAYWSAPRWKPYAYNLAQAIRQRVEQHWPSDPKRLDSVRLKFSIAIFNRPDVVLLEREDGSSMPQTISNHGDCLVIMLQDYQPVPSYTFKSAAFNELFNSDLLNFMRIAKTAGYITTDFEVTLVRTTPGHFRVTQCRFI